MIKTYLFIKKNRFRKKISLYKQVFNLMFDFTLLIYILLFIGYFFYAAFQNGELFQTIDMKGVSLERFSIEYIWLIITVLPLTYLLQSNRHSGVLFSSADYLLLILPYDRRLIWIMLACERWMRSLIFYIMFGTILYVLTSISLGMIIFYVLLLLLINILMTIPQWRLFQSHFIVKLSAIIFMIIVNVLNLVSNTPFIGIFFLLLLLLVQPVLWRRNFNSVDWQNTRASGDFYIWNMIILSHVTKVHVKRDNQSSILQRLRFWKKPFVNEKAIYRRVWYVYLEKNIKIILQLTGILIVMQWVILFINRSYFPIAIALTIFAYTTFLAVLFEDRFMTGIIRQLPWNLTKYKRTFLSWAMYPVYLFLVSIIVFIIQQPIMWTIPLLILYIGTFFMQFDLKINRSMSRIKSNLFFVDDNLLLNVFFLVIICFSQVFPFLSLCSIYFIYLTIRKKFFI